MLLLKGCGGGSPPFPLKIYFMFVDKVSVDVQSQALSMFVDKVSVDVQSQALSMFVDRVKSAYDVNW